MTTATAETDQTKSPGEARAVELRSQSPVALFGGIDVQAIMDKAIDAGSTVDVIERLVALIDRKQADFARAKFDEALLAFKAECPVIRKTKTIDGKVKYAPIEDIEEVIGPICQKYGFTHTFNIDASSKPGTVKVVCLVSAHGHTRQSELEMPLPEKSKMMSNSSQQYGGAISYARRYALQNAYGLVIAGEDRDGRGLEKPSGPSTVQPSRADLKPLAVELWNLLTPCIDADDRPKRNWLARNKWLWAQEILDAAIPEEAPELSRARFEQVIERVKEALI